MLKNTFRTSSPQLSITQKSTNMPRIPLIYSNARTTNPQTHLVTDQIEVTLLADSSGLTSRHRGFAKKTISHISNQTITTQLSHTIQSDLAEASTS